MKNNYRLKPRSVIFMWSLSMMLLLLSAAGGSAEPSLEVAQTIEAATQLEEGVSDVCDVVEIPASDFLSDSDESLPADESASYVEVDLLLDSNQIGELPLLLNSLQSWQREGKVSEFELVEQNRLRLFSDSSTIEALYTLPSVCEVIESEEESRSLSTAEGTLADFLPSEEAVANEAGIPASWDSDHNFLGGDGKQTEETREYWLILEPTQREFLPALSEALERLQAQGLVLDFEALSEENNTLKVLATTKAYSQLKQLPIISAVALSAPPLSLNSRSQGEGVITGTIRANDGTPLEDIYISVGYDFYQTDSWVWFHGGSTNAQGAYTVNLSQGGSYRLNFYDPDGVYLSEYYNNASQFENASNIKVIVGETTTGIDAQLDKGGRITGTVSDEDGNPIDEIQVTIYYYDEEADEWEVARYTYTNADGFYDAHGLKNDTYRVAFDDRADKYRSEFYHDALEIEDGSDVVVTLAETTANINASLEELGHITGRVLNDEGTPLPNIQVTVYQNDEVYDYWDEAIYDYTDTQGQYDIHGLETGSYRVGFFDSNRDYLPQYYLNATALESATNVAVQTSQTTANINAQLKKAGRITGRVLNDEGTPLPNIKVTAYQNYEVYNYWHEANYDYTDTQGQYNINGLETGSYQVGFSDSNRDYLSQYYQNTTEFESATNVAVQTSQTTANINAQLKKAGHITGIVGAATSQRMTNSASPTRIVGDNHIYLPFIATSIRNPLANIKVNVYQYDEEENEWWRKGEDETDTNGRYDINGLDTGIYRLVFFDPRDRYLDKYYKDGLELDRATDVEVVAGQITSRINQLLDEGGKITGQVLDENSHPVPYTRVYTYYYDDEEVYWDWVGSSETDFEGSYTIAGLETGDYRVCFANNSAGYLPKCYGDVTDFYSVPQIAVTQGETSSGIDVRLDKKESESGEIHGTISNAEAEPLPDIDVLVLWYEQETDDWWLVDRVSSNANGEYQVKGLKNGTYRLLFDDEEGDYLVEYYDNVTEFASATNLSVTAGQTLTNIDAQLKDAAHISGIIRGADGSPLSDAFADVYRYNETLNDWQLINYDYTDSNGYYDVGGLHSGNYRLYFFDDSDENLPEYYQNAADIESASDVTVTAGQTTTGIDGDLAKSGSITGVVRDTEGNPIEYIWVSAYQYNAEEQEWQRINSSRTRTNGEYEIKGLNNGTYRLYFSGTWTSYVSEYYHNATEIESATDIEVTAGQATSGIDAELERGGRLTGTVTNANDEPLKGVEVYASCNDCDYNHAIEIEISDTNRQGEYEIDGLQPGSYRVKFSSSKDNYLSEYYDNAFDIESATTITVTAKQTVSDIDAQLALGGKVRGVVTDADGQPLRWVKVSAYQYDDEEESWQTVSSDYSNLYGKYEIEKLPTGNYRIGFSDSRQKHVSEYYDNVTDIDEALDLSVTAGETISDINASLDRSGRIIGQISNPAGRKLSYIRVTAYQYDEQEESWQAINSDYTNSQGYYNLGALDTGSYRLHFQDLWAEYAPEYYDDVLDLESATDVPVVVEQTTADIDAELDIGGRLRGTVSDADGNRLDDIWVKALQALPDSEQGEEVKTTLTNNAGEYQTIFRNLFSKWHLARQK